MHIEEKRWRNKGREEIRADWVKRGFSCELWVDPPGQRWEDYLHEVDELVTPLNAAIEIVWEGENAMLDPGDEWYIPKNTCHSVRNTSTETVQWLYGYRKK